ncbi:MAG: hypothetical protein ACI9HU_000633 [Colwellia sp.]|jgi:hypothetical protein
MFLIEFKEGQFVDAEKINYVALNNNEVIFSTAGDNESIFTVDKISESNFMKYLQVLNRGESVLSRHVHINNPDTKY